MIRVGLGSSGSIRRAKAITDEEETSFKGEQLKDKVLWHGRWREERKKGSANKSMMDRHNIHLIECS